MKDLIKLFNECIEECDAVGIKYGVISSITSNNRYTKKWGNCKKVNGTFQIQISSRLLDDKVSDEATKNTIMHEILHTVENCMNHKIDWKIQAGKMNYAYSYYNIKTKTTFEEKRITKPKVTYSYVFKCKNCGAIIRRQKNSKFVQNYQNYTCGKCKGKLEKIMF